jgi:hypothetical protein
MYDLDSIACLFPVLPDLRVTAVKRVDMRTADTSAVACICAIVTQMHQAYIDAVSKTKQAVEATRLEASRVAELRSKAAEYSRCARPLPEC